ncbi:MAG: transcriptional regulator [Cytophagales bacterium]|nr:MAG: transcriptional regulator [Cytophagales bacterium]
MEQLEIQNINGIQVVDSRIIAKGLNIKHRNLIETINKYKNELEQLGILPFETEVLGVGQPQKFYFLNELQCSFVVTLSRNTPEVVQFKLALVIAFDNAKKEVKLLEEVINESENYHYKIKKEAILFRQPQFGYLKVSKVII